MEILKEKKIVEKIDIGIKEPQKWSEKDIAELKDQAREIARNRSEDQRLRNELMAIKFEIEEYVNSNRSSNRSLTLEKIVGNYLEILGLPFRKFAFHLDTTDGNLKKYLSGERRFNTDLAMKFGHFFHTSPELWLQLQTKNELLNLRKEKKQVKYYEKYDYKKAVRS